MSAVTTSIGLASGIESGKIIDALINASRGSVLKLQGRKTEFEAVKTGLGALEAFVLTLSTGVDTLGRTDTFDAVAALSSDADALAVSADRDAIPGTYSFTPLRSASAHAVRTRGFASADSPLGTGEVVLSRGGGLVTDTPLDLLNGGAGVRRGTVRVTDAAGAGADVDLSAARTVTDVLDAFNSAAGLSVEARVEGDRFVLTDRGGGAGALSVVDLAGGKTAADLGLTADAGAADGTVATSGGTAAVRTGGAVFAATADFTLDLLDDGLGVHTASGADLNVTLSDGTALFLNLDEAGANGGPANTVADVLAAVEGHASNDDGAGGKKVTAAVTDGRVVLTDLTGGAGTLSVEDVGSANVTRALGLDATAAGGTLTGDRLAAGLNSVLLRNLGGGTGVTAGTVRLTDRSGATADLDLSAAESLDEVVAAVDGAGLSLAASVDDAGTGLVLRDTSGGAGNLRVEDLSGSLAADLGLAVDAAQNTVSSGSLKLRHVGRNTSLADFGPGKTAVPTGSFRITDSAGDSANVTVTADDETLGDVLDRINAAGVGVTASLNATGDGFTLTDTAGGPGTPSVDPGDTADALRIGGEDADGDGSLTARRAAVVVLEEGDTLADLASKLSAAGAGVSATVFDDGTSLAPARLLISAADAGTAGRFFLDAGLLNLGAETSAVGRDALLGFGGAGGDDFLLASSDGNFDDLPGGLGATLGTPTGQPVTVTVVRDTAAVGRTLGGFVDAYNNFLATADTLTRFDPATGERGILQGNGVVSRVRNRLRTLIDRPFGPAASSSNGGSGDAPRTLFDLGVRLGKNGRLSLKSDRLARALADDADAVRAFFTDPSGGFGTTADEVLDSLTDPFDGLFEIEGRSLDTRTARLDSRIEELEASLAVRRDRLVRQYAAMEETISRFNSFQQSLDSIGPLRVDSKS